jgi:hypothetical protein
MIKKKIQIKMPPFGICKIDYAQIAFISVFLHNIKVNFYALIFATHGGIKNKKNCNGSIFSESMYLVCRKKC